MPQFWMLVVAAAGRCGDSQHWHLRAMSLGWTIRPQRCGLARQQCQGDRGRTSPDRAGFGGRFAVPRSHVRHYHGRRDALLLARPARQRPRELEGTQTRWEFRPNCRNVPRRAFPATLRYSNAAAPRRIPQRRRAPGPPDPGRIHRGRDHAPVREKLDLRHGPQAAIAGPVPGPRGLAGSASRDSGPLAGYLEIIYILSLVIQPPSAEELRRLPSPPPSADELRSRAIGKVLLNLATYNIEGVRPEDQ